MLPEILNLSFSSNMELFVYTEQYMSAMADFHQKALESPLLPQISLIFEEKKPNWKEEIYTLLMREEYGNLKQLNTRLILLEKLLTLYNIETKLQKIPFLDRVNSLDKMEEVWKKTIFSLRRIELQAGERPQSLLLNLLYEWNFSEEYLLLAIKEGLIHHKQITLDRIIQYLASGSFSLYAEAVQNYMRRHNYSVSV